MDCNRILIIFSNEIILQWGTIYNLTGERTVYLPCAYKNELLSLTGGLIAGIPETTYEHMTFYNVYKNRFDFKTFDNYGCFWLSIGH